MAHLPLSRFWLESHLGITDTDRLMFVEAGQRLPPLCEKGNLLLVDRTIEGPGMRVSTCCQGVLGWSQEMCAFGLTKDSSSQA